jgi:site-specific DNA recombinase
VRNILDSYRVAGIRVFRGEELKPGTWPAIIDRGQWEEVRQLRTYRTEQNRAKRTPRRYYLLRGVVTCSTCGRRMAGSASDVPRAFRTTCKLTISCGSSAT